MNKPTSPWIDAEVGFGQRGMQYYIAGRFLAIAQQFPVCANLLHHAVEMFLKSALCRTHSREQIYALNHNLHKAWLAFKSAHPDPRLDALDSAVSAINKFERIRYPDESLYKGMIGTFTLERAHKATARSYSLKPLPQYALVLEDLDEIIKLIFELGAMNPHFYLNSTAPTAAAVLNDRNAHPFPPAT